MGEELFLGSWASRCRALLHEIEESVGRVGGIAIAHGGWGPADADCCRWPDASEQSPVRSDEPPALNQVRHGRAHDLDKELPDDLGRDLTVIVGRSVFLTVGGASLREDEHWMGDP